MLHGKPNKEILDELNTYVYGHEEAKKALINLVNRSKIRYYQKWGQLVPRTSLINPSKCLLIGGSGTGKTHLVQSLAKILDFPLLIVDATKFNPTGASGGIKPDGLKNLIYKTADQYAQDESGKYFSAEGTLDQMVVFVDEFDKLSSHYDGSSGNWNEHVQTHFLTMFENSDELDGISWVFAGAFSGMDKQTKEHIKHGIGFNPEPCDIINGQELTDEDIISYGMLPEIVGRLTSICRLDTLTEQDFYNILKQNTIPKKLLELSYFGIDEHLFEEEYLRKLAKEASISSQGVRYLYRALEKYFIEAEFNYEDFKYDM